MYLADYHHHTDNSFDSKASMMEVCEQAVRRGVHEICFTEHFSVNPNVPTYGHMDFDRYFRQINECRNKFNDRLIIKAGIELCEPHLLMKDYSLALKEQSFDFIMGSVHNINEQKLRLYMKNKDVKAVYQGYFEEVYALVSQADIDVLAHLDLMKRYAIDSIGNYYLSDFQLIIVDILNKAIDRGIGLEINTSGILNKKVKEPFPSLGVLKLYKALGGKF
ncbi:histidinol-phosphatase HisJ family protein [Bacillus sp. N9]